MPNLWEEAEGMILSDECLDTLRRADKLIAEADELIALHDMGGRYLQKLQEQGEEEDDDSRDSTSHSAGVGMESTAEAEVD